MAGWDVVGCGKREKRVRERATEGQTNLLLLLGELLPFRGGLLGASLELVAVADLGAYHVQFAEEQRVGGGWASRWLLILPQLDACESQKNGINT